MTTPAHAEVSPIAGELTRAERIADICVHAIGLGAALVGVSVLLAVGLPRVVGGTAVGLLLYGLALLAMLACSLLYNASTDPRRRDFYRRLDHSAIFLMIAGTYTPFALGKLAGPWGEVLLAVIWGFAAFGIALKMLWPTRLRRLTIVFYLAMGWLAFLVLGPMLESIGPTLGALMIAGGVLYTAGIVFHLWNGLRFNTAIWHGFVVAAAACHYVVVLAAIALGRATAGV